MVYPTRFQVVGGFPESCFESVVFCDSRGDGEKRGEDGEPEVHVHVHVDKHVTGEAGWSAGFTGLCYEPRPGRGLALFGHKKSAPHLNPRGVRCGANFVLWRFLGR